uniref:UV radiation resistance-associated gene protein n=1 Tax=Glossina brevipalpis TaxID=37001 RepID=A0A1A9WUD8_9MUSC
MNIRHIRPRCREWLPLCSQQLRLRNLQSIQGINIGDDGTDARTADCLLYYTLHDHHESPSFYESEKLPYRKHLQQRWAEIQCAELLKSNANCVCVKVWIWQPKMGGKMTADIYEKNQDINASKEPVSALTREFLKFNKQQQHPDKLLLSWAVYFSGLIPIYQPNETKCCNNTLIFQMNGEFFTSPEHFSIKHLGDQLNACYQRFSKTGMLDISMPISDEFSINSPHVSRSSSPDVANWQKDLLRISKTRYPQLNCEGTNVHKSYKLDKLLEIQQLQRGKLRTERKSIELTEQIKMISLRCITKDQLKRGARTASLNANSSMTLTTSSHECYYNNSMGRTLSMLLAEQQRIEPNQLFKAQKLQQQIETLQSKHRSLNYTRAIYAKRIEDLRQRLAEASATRIQLQTWLCAKQHKLSAKKEEWNEYLATQLERRQRKHIIAQYLERRRSSLCMELTEIYPISRNREGLYTICGVPFPFVDGYDYESSNANNFPCSDNTTPLALSASLGYVAHLVQMIAVVTNRPLRNPIIHEGSHTRILNVVIEMPLISREYPLYSRSSIPTKPVRHGINLLNQNIAQLCYEITEIRCDMHASIENLLHIFRKLAEIEQSTIDVTNKLSSNNNNKCLTILTNDKQQILYHNNHNHVHQQEMYYKSRNGKDVAALTKSQSSLEINALLSKSKTASLVHNLALNPNKVLINAEEATPPDDAELGSTTGSNERACRSVGSYSDSEEDCHTMQCYSNSDSNLTFQSVHQHI